ncbi:MAG: LysE family transporter [Paracoccus sp. (in: a-proteobacteria)]|uniref:LysE family translocator n=1 Tax=Paracoccus sp. TaxID=267 RepID=UPI003242E82E
MEVNLLLVLLAAFVASASPWPATLAIAGTSMVFGRSSGLPIASGITVGSLTWSVAAALGLGTIMLANVWLFEMIRYGGAAYLIYLAYQSARSALSRNDVPMKSMTGNPSTLFAKGPMLHITNPKSILFFGSLYSMAIPAGTPIGEPVVVIAAVGIQSIVIFHGYALLFSSKTIARLYRRVRRVFKGLFAVGFGAAGIKIAGSAGPWTSAS